eukprot:758823-Hanusia_phi.AAC.3
MKKIVKGHRLLALLVRPSPPETAVRPQGGGNGRYQSTPLACCYTQPSPIDDNLTTGGGEGPNSVVRARCLHPLRA